MLIEIRKGGRAVLPESVVASHDVIVNKDATLIVVPNDSTAAERLAAADEGASDH